MTTTHHVRGQVPPDSPLQALAGRTVTLPARSLPELAVRVAELRAANVDPHVMPARYVPWTPIAVSLTAAVIAAVAAALAAFVTGHTTGGWVASGAAILLGVGLFPTLLHLEMDR